MREGGIGPIAPQLHSTLPAANIVSCIHTCTVSGTIEGGIQRGGSSASKNTDSSIFYTEIEAKILKTDSDPKNTDRDPIIRVIAIQQIIVTLR